MSLEHYLDGAGSIDLFPPSREYRIDHTHTQQVIEELMRVEGITMEEAFGRELDTLKRKHREIRIGQFCMTALMLVGLAATTILTLYNLPAYLALPPYLLAFVSLTLAQVRYRRRIRNGLV